MLAIPALNIALPKKPANQKNPYQTSECLQAASLKTGDFFKKVRPLWQDTLFCGKNGSVTPEFETWSRLMCVAIFGYLSYDEVAFGQYICLYMLYWSGKAMLSVHDI